MLDDQLFQLPCFWRCFSQKVKTKKPWTKPISSEMISRRRKKKLKTWRKTTQMTDYFHSFMMEWTAIKWSTANDIIKSESMLKLLTYNSWQYVRVKPERRDTRHTPHVHFRDSLHLNATFIPKAFTFMYAMRGTSGQSSFVWGNEQHLSGLDWEWSWQRFPELHPSESSCLQTSERNTVLLLVVAQCFYSSLFFLRYFHF